MNAAQHRDQLDSQFRVNHNQSHLDFRGRTTNQITQRRSISWIWRRGMLGGVIRISDQRQCLNLTNHTTRFHQHWQMMKHMILKRKDQWLG